MAAVETRDGLSDTGEAASREDEKVGFEINGEFYSLPVLDTLTLDEERVLYIYADTIIRDFSPPHPEAPEEEQLASELYRARKFRNPDFKRALAHIAYRRRHPEVTDVEVEKAIGMANAFAVEFAMFRGDDDNPPVMSSQKQPESRSDTSGHSKHGASGSPTKSSSDPADESRAPTGTTASGTSSPGAAPIGSER